MKRLLMDRLVEWKKSKDRKPLLLKGVRQVGKTHLLKEFGHTHFRKCHYINFEKQPNLARFFTHDLNPKRILDELGFYLDQQIKIGEDLVIFDEIQEESKALTSLKYFQEDCPDLHLCAAGSLLGLHLNSGSFPVGKVDFETLYPMSFEEFLMAGDDKSLPILKELKSKGTISDIVHEHLWEELKRYLIVGGLPEVVFKYFGRRENLLEAFEIVRKKQDDLLNSYYADIAKHSGKVNAMHIDRVFRAVPTQLRQAQDGSTARFKFRGVVPGVSHYDRLAGAIDWLEAAGLVMKVQIVNTGHLPFKAYTKENFFKLLIFDVGILGLMSGLSPKVIMESKCFVENFVAQEFAASKRGPLYCWEEKKCEIEFL